ncbi:hypothetical protein [Catellatospora tritici]|uniref:hypothetical protein n=1 Tax=Catellatospora tritici TaxID=2851566 RepID=UPI001C2D0FC6|nr:hypothetical protein [Catellatospora tritici]MBV1850785.1 hypothetical protein [Catellatospora tritici]MBV1851038.1 hypothetical protein [Catellatospora tritici]
MPGQRRTGLLALLAGLVLAVVTALAVWAVAPSYADTEEQPCPPAAVKGTPPPCIQPWIWPDDRPYP